MKKLTCAQLESIASGDGIFGRDVWRCCVGYLQVSLSDADPSSAAAWDRAMVGVQSLVEWLIAQCRRKFGSVAAECLRTASTHGMRQEKHHEQNLLPCIFSRRCSPLEYTCATHNPRTLVASTRMQRSFYTWKHHEKTGLQCPEDTCAYVYESQFSHLIEAVYVLGHAGEILQRTARAEPSASTDEWMQLPVWERANTQLCGVMQCVHLYLADGLTLL